MIPFLGGKSLLKKIIMPCQWWKKIYRNVHKKSQGALGWQSPSSPAHHYISSKQSHVACPWKNFWGCPFWKVALLAVWFICGPLDGQRIRTNPRQLYLSKNVKVVFFFQGLRRVICVPMSNLRMMKNSELWYYDMIEEKNTSDSNHESSPPPKNVGFHRHILSCHPSHVPGHHQDLFTCYIKNLHLPLLLKVQKSQTTTWDGAKTRRKQWDRIVTTFTSTGACRKPEFFHQQYYRANPSKLPYIYIVWFRHIG